MTKISAKHLREIALEAQLHERAVERLVGSINVESRSRKLNLGLRVEEHTPLDDDTAEILKATIKGYIAACPVVVGWIGRGDFNAQKPRKEITPGKLLHACRTAGRLRARFLREVGLSKVG